MEKYYIKPRLKKHWFKKNKVVYDLIERIREKRWVDVTYGNGGGDFIDYQEDLIVDTFKDIISAEKVKRKLEKL